MYLTYCQFEGVNKTFNSYVQFNCLLKSPSLVVIHAVGINTHLIFGAPLADISVGFNLDSLATISLLMFVLQSSHKINFML